MRIVSGAWRGRALVAPPGQGTRPTADRVRQALFDMLMHAEWGGRAAIEDAVVLDVFAGTGALGLEALSRGAGFVSFFEQDAAALKALRANVAACKAERRVDIVAGDVLSVSARQQPTRGQISDVPPGYQPPADTGRSAGTGAAAGQPGTLVFLDPPYGRALVPRAVACLREAGRIAPDALFIAETGSDEAWVPDALLLAERRHGAARIVVFRLS